MRSDQPPPQYKNSLMCVTFNEFASDNDGFWLRNFDAVNERLISEVCVDQSTHAAQFGQTQPHDHKLRPGLHHQINYITVPVNQHITPNTFLTTCMSLLFSTRIYKMEGKSSTLRVSFFPFTCQLKMCEPANVQAIR